MDEVSRLSLAVDSSGVRRAATDLRALGQAGRQSEQSAQRLESSFQSLRNVLAGVSAAVVVRNIVQQADAYSNLNARLQLVTKSSQEFAAAQTALFNIAQRSGTGLEQTADLFGSLSRSTEALGLSQSRVLAVTETINQALAVSGTSAQGAAAALVQLGQGFSAGALRGEELNSVLEQAPRLARAISDGLGVPIGELRKLGEQGQLTGEQVFQSLERSAAGIGNEFQRLPLTVGRASTQAQNALLALIGTLDQTSGASASFAQVISDSAGFMAELAVEIRKVAEGGASISIVANAFVTLRETVAVVAANVSFVLKGIGREIGAIGAQLAALGRADFAGFRAISEAVRADGERARAELDRLEQRLLRRVALPDLGQTDPRELARRGRPAQAFGNPRAVAPVAPRQTRETVSDAQRFLENLQKQLQGTQELTTAETVLAEIQSGRLKLSRGITQDQLLGIAQEIDATKEAQRVARERADERNREYEEAIEASRELQRAEDERLRALLSNTPSQVFQQQQADIEFLRQKLDAATISAQQYGEAVGQVIGNNNKDIKTQADFVKELGLTFSSAFENAIVAGSGLRDLLKGLEQDLLRLITRQLVTKPLAEGIGNFLTGFGGGGDAGSFAGFVASLFGGARANGGDIQAGRAYRINERGPGEVFNVGERQYLLAGANGSVAPAPSRAMSVTVNQSFAPGTDRRTINQAAAATARVLQSATLRNG